MSTLVKLIVLFFVIFDPFMSLAVFSSLTGRLSGEERRKTALLAILVASMLSYIVLFLGETILQLFSTNIHDFKIAGGIILAILGVRMVLGQSITDPRQTGEQSAKAIAAIIGTPLLTGPAAITAIIVSTSESGMATTGLAIGLVLVFTGILFLQAARISRLLGTTVIQIFSTVLGLITLSWGVTMVRSGLDF